MVTRARKKIVVIAVATAILTGVAALFSCRNDSISYSPVLLCNFGTVGERSVLPFASFAPARLLAVSAEYVVTGDARYLYVWNIDGMLQGKYDYHEILAKKFAEMGERDDAWPNELPVRLHYIALSGRYAAFAGGCFPGVLLMSLPTTQSEATWRLFVTRTSGRIDRWDGGIAFAPFDSQCLLVAMLGRLAKLCLRTGVLSEQQCYFGMGSPWGVTPTAKLVAAAGGDRIAVYDIGKPEARIYSDKDGSYRLPVEAICWSPCGTEIAVGEVRSSVINALRGERSAAILSYPCMEVLDRFKVTDDRGKSMLRTLAYDDSGEFLLWTTSKDIVGVYDKRRKKQVLSLVLGSGATASYWTEAAWVPGQRATFVTMSNGGAIQKWTFR